MSLPYFFLDPGVMKAKTLVAVPAIGVAGAASCAALQHGSLFDVISLDPATGAHVHIVHLAAGAGFDLVESFSALALLLARLLLL
ncbi:MAG: hypothetical protein OXC26_21200 [Albidovulum sp.]|nr:hypothetical protein [Albidovulum sp.]